MVGVKDAQSEALRIPIEGKTSNLIVVRSEGEGLFTEHQITAANVVNGAVTLWKEEEQRKKGRTRRNKKEAVNNEIYLSEGKVGIVWGAHEMC